VECRISVAGPYPWIELRGMGEMLLSALVFFLKICEAPEIANANGVVKGVLLVSK
jgi:hypothetical protein